MRSLAFITLFGLLLLPTLASERYHSSKDKFLASDLIVVGTVESISLGEIRKFTGHTKDTQHTELRLTVEKSFYGNAPKNIAIHCNSVNYTIGHTIHRCTAGFSSTRVKKGKKYIAYLKKAEGKFYLAGESNQYLADVSDAQERLDRLEEDLPGLTLLKERPHSPEAKAFSKKLDARGKLRSKGKSISLEELIPELKLLRERPNSPEAKAFLKKMEELLGNQLTAEEILKILMFKAPQSKPTKDAHEPADPGHGK